MFIHHIHVYFRSLKLIFKNNHYSDDTFSLFLSVYQLLREKLSVVDLSTWNWCWSVWENTRPIFFLENINPISYNSFIILFCFNCSRGIFCVENYDLNLFIEAANLFIMTPGYLSLYVPLCIFPQLTALAFHTIVSFSNINIRRNFNFPVGFYCISYFVLPVRALPGVLSGFYLVSCWSPCR
jgi:hypothetical protein